LDLPKEWSVHMVAPAPAALRLPEQDAFPEDARHAEMRPEMRFSYSKVTPLDLEDAVAASVQRLVIEEVRKRALAGTLTYPDVRWAFDKKSPVEIQDYFEKLTDEQAALMERELSPAETGRITETVERDVEFQIEKARGPLDQALGKLRAAGFGDEAALVEDLYQKVLPYLIKSQDISPIYHITHVLNFMAEILVDEFAKGSVTRTDVKNGMTAALFHDSGIGYQTLRKIRESDIDDVQKAIDAMPETNEPEREAKRLKRLEKEALRKKAILSRQQHMMAAGEIAALVLKDDARFSAADEAAVRDIVETHDNSKIPLLEDTIDSKWLLSPGKKDWLKQLHWEADALEMLTEDNNEVDRERTRKYGGTPMEPRVQYEYNRVLHRKYIEDVYEKASGIDLAAYGFKDGLLYRSEKGYEIYKRLVAQFYAAHPEPKTEMRAHHDKMPRQAARHIFLESGVLGLVAALTHALAAALLAPFSWQTVVLPLAAGLLSGAVYFAYRAHRYFEHVDSLLRAEDTRQAVAQRIMATGREIDLLSQSLRDQRRVVQDFFREWHGGEEIPHALIREFLEYVAILKRFDEIEFGDNPLHPDDEEKFLDWREKYQKNLGPSLLEAVQVIASLVRSGALSETALVNAKQLKAMETHLKAMPEKIAALRRYLNGHPHWKYENLFPEEPEGRRAEIRPNITRSDELLIRLGFRAGHGGEVHLTPEELKVLLAEGKFSLISIGQNPKGEGLSKEELERRFRRLKEILTEEGYLFTLVKGFYGGEEDSFLIMVHEANAKVILHLAAQFDQESIIYSDHGKQALVYTDMNRPALKSNSIEFPPGPGENYTEVTHEDGTRSRFGFHFRGPEQKPELRTSAAAAPKPLAVFIGSINLKLFKMIGERADVTRFITPEDDVNFPDVFEVIDGVEYKLLGAGDRKVSIIDPDKLLERVRQLRPDGSSVTLVFDYPQASYPKLGESYVDLAEQTLTAAGYKVTRFQFSMLDFKLEEEDRGGEWSPEMMDLVEGEMDEHFPRPAPLAEVAGKPAVHAVTIDWNLLTGGAETLNGIYEELVLHVADQVLGEQKFAAAKEGLRQKLAALRPKTHGLSPLEAFDQHFLPLLMEEKILVPEDAAGDAAVDKAKANFMAVQPLRHYASLLEVDSRLKTRFDRARGIYDRLPGSLIFSSLADFMAAHHALKNGVTYAPGARETLDYFLGLGIPIFLTTEISTDLVEAVVPREIRDKLETNGGKVLGGDRDWILQVKKLEQIYGDGKVLVVGDAPGHARGAQARHLDFAAVSQSPAALEPFAPKGVFQDFNGLSAWAAEHYHFAKRPELRSDQMGPLQPIHAVVLDWDGTLSDSEDLVKEVQTNATLEVARSVLGAAFGAKEADLRTKLHGLKDTLRGISAGETFLDHFLPLLNREGVAVTEAEAARILADYAQTLTLTQRLNRPFLVDRPKFHELDGAHVFSDLTSYLITDRMQQEGVKYLPGAEQALEKALSLGVPVYIVTGIADKFLTLRIPLPVRRKIKESGGKVIGGDRPKTITMQRLTKVYGKGSILSIGDGSAEARAAQETGQPFIAIESAGASGLRDFGPVHQMADMTGFEAAAGRFQFSRNGEQEAEKTSIHAVVFDWDGTVADSREVVIEAHTNLTLKMAEASMGAADFAARQEALREKMKELVSTLQGRATAGLVRDQYLPFLEKEGIKVDLGKAKRALLDYASGLKFTGELQARYDAASARFASLDIPDLVSQIESFFVAGYEMQHGEKMLPFGEDALRAHATLGIPFYIMTGIPDEFIEFRIPARIRELVAASGGEIIGGNRTKLESMKRITAIYGPGAILSAGDGTGEADAAMQTGQVFVAVAASDKTRDTLARYKPALTVKDLSGLQAWTEEHYVFEPKSELRSQTAPSVNGRRSPLAPMIIINKPVGHDSVGNKRRFPHVPVALEVVPEQFRAPGRSLYGRLDKMTSGLMIYGGHGMLQHFLMDPTSDGKIKVSKVYEAVVSGRMTREEARQLVRKGVAIRVPTPDGRSSRDYLAKAENAYVLENFTIDGGYERSRVRIVLTEGKYHQVRKMLAAVNHGVIELKRISVGPIKLGGLKEGEWRELEPHEYAWLEEVYKNALMASGKRFPSFLRTRNARHYEVNGRAQADGKSELRTAAETPEIQTPPLRSEARGDDRKKKKREERKREQRKRDDAKNIERRKEKKKAFEASDERRRDRAQQRRELMQQFGLEPGAGAVTGGQLAQSLLGALKQMTGPEAAKIVSVVEDLKNRLFALGEESDAVSRARLAAREGHRDDYVPPEQMKDAAARIFRLLNLKAGEKLLEINPGASGGVALIAALMGLDVVVVETNVEVRGVGKPYNPYQLLNKTVETYRDLITALGGSLEIIPGDYAAQSVREKAADEGPFDVVVATGLNQASPKAADMLAALSETLQEARAFYGGFPVSEDVPASRRAVLDAFAKIEESSVEAGRGVSYERAPAPLSFGFTSARLYHFTDRAAPEDPRPPLPYKETDQGIEAATFQGKRTIDMVFDAENRRALEAYDRETGDNVLERLARLLSQYPKDWRPGDFNEEIGDSADGKRTVKLVFKKPVVLNGEETDSLEATGVLFTEENLGEDFLGMSMGHMSMNVREAGARRGRDGGVDSSYAPDGRVVLTPARFSQYGGHGAITAEEKFNHSRTTLPKKGFRSPIAVAHGTYRVDQGANKRIEKDGRQLGVFVSATRKAVPERFGHFDGLIQDRYLAAFDAATERDKAAINAFVMKTAKAYLINPVETAKRVAQMTDYGRSNRTYGRKLRAVVDAWLYPNQPHKGNVAFDPDEDWPEIWFDLGGWKTGEELTPEQRFGYFYSALNYGITVITRSLVHNTMMETLYHEGAIDPFGDFLEGFFYDQLDNPSFSRRDLKFMGEHRGARLEETQTNLQLAIQSEESLLNPKSLPPLYKRLDQPFVPLIRQIFGFREDGLTALKPEERKKKAEALYAKFRPRFPGPSARGLTLAALEAWIDLAPKDEILVRRELTALYDEYKDKLAFEDQKAELQRELDALGDDIMAAPEKPQAPELSALPATPDAWAEKIIAVAQGVMARYDSRPRTGTERDQFWISFTADLDAVLKQLFNHVQDPALAAAALDKANAWWNAQGLEPKLGGLMEHFILVYKEFMPSAVFAGEQRRVFETVQKTSAIEDRLWAWWLYAVATAYHLRHFGVHVEPLPGQAPKAMDNEILGFLVRDFLLPDYLTWRTAHQSEIAAGETRAVNIQKNMLWALGLALDVRLYDADGLVYDQDLEQGTPVIPARVHFQNGSLDSVRELYLPVMKAVAEAGLLPEVLKAMEDKSLVQDGQIPKLKPSIPLILGRGGEGLRGIGTLTRLTLETLYEGTFGSAIDFTRLDPAAALRLAMQAPDEDRMVRYLAEEIEARRLTAGQLWKQLADLTVPFQQPGGDLNLAAITSPNAAENLARIKRLMKVADTAFRYQRRLFTGKMIEDLEDLKPGTVVQVLNRPGTGREGALYEALILGIDSHDNVWMITDSGEQRVAPLAELAHVRAGTVVPVLNPATVQMHGHLRNELRSADERPADEVMEELRAMDRSGISPALEVQVTGMSSATPRGLYVNYQGVEGFIDEDDLAGDVEDYRGFIRGTMNVYLAAAQDEVGGQLMPVFVPLPEKGQGEVLEASDEEALIDELRRAQELGTPVPVTVTMLVLARHEGEEFDHAAGFEVRYKGLEGFMPYSEGPDELRHQNSRDFEKLSGLMLGRQLNVLVNRVEQSHDGALRPVVSAREAEARERKSLTRGQQIELKIVELNHPHGDKALEPTGVISEAQGFRFYTPFFRIPEALLGGGWNSLPGKTVPAEITDPEKMHADFLPAAETRVPAAELKAAHLFKTVKARVEFISHRGPAENFAPQGLVVSWDEGRERGLVTLRDLGLALPEGAAERLEMLRALVGTERDAFIHDFHGREALMVFSGSQTAREALARSAADGVPVTVTIKELVLRTDNGSGHEYAAGFHADYEGIELFIPYSEGPDLLHAMDSKDFAALRLALIGKQFPALVRAATKAHSRPMASVREAELVLSAPPAEGTEIEVSIIALKHPKGDTALEPTGVISEYKGHSFYTPFFKIPAPLLTGGWKNLIGKKVRAVVADRSKLLADLLAPDAPQTEIRVPPQELQRNFDFRKVKVRVEFISHAGADHNYEPQGLLVSWNDGKEQGIVPLRFTPGGVRSSLEDLRALVGHEMEARIIDFRGRVAEMTMKSVLETRLGDNPGRYRPTVTVAMARFAMGLPMDAIRAYGQSKLHPENQDLKTEAALLNGRVLEALEVLTENKKIRFITDLLYQLGKPWMREQIADSLWMLERWQLYLDELHAAAVALRADIEAVDLEDRMAVAVLTPGQELVIRGHKLDARNADIVVRLGNLLTGEPQLGRELAFETESGVIATHRQDWLHKPALYVAPDGSVRTEAVTKTLSRSQAGGVARGLLEVYPKNKIVLYGPQSGQEILLQVQFLDDGKIILQTPEEALKRRGAEIFVRPVPPAEEAKSELRTGTEAPQPPQDRQRHLTDAQRGEYQTKLEKLRVRSVMHGVSAAIFVSALFFLAGWQIALAVLLPAVLYQFVRAAAIVGVWIYGKSTGNPAIAKISPAWPTWREWLHAVPAHEFSLSPAQVWAIDFSGAYANLAAGIAAAVAAFAVPPLALPLGIFAGLNLLRFAVQVFVPASPQQQALNQLITVFEPVLVLNRIRDFFSSDAATRARLRRRGEEIREAVTSGMRTVVGEVVRAKADNDDVFYLLTARGEVFRADRVEGQEIKKPMNEAAAVFEADSFGIVSVVFNFQAKLVPGRPTVKAGKQTYAVYRIKNFPEFLRTPEKPAAQKAAEPEKPAEVVKPSGPLALEIDETAQEAEAAARREAIAAAMREFEEAYFGEDGALGKKAEHYVRQAAEKKNQKVSSFAKQFAHDIDQVMGTIKTKYGLQPNEMKGLTDYREQYLKDMKDRALAAQSAAQKARKAARDEAELDRLIADEAAVQAREEEDRLEKARAAERTVLSSGLEALKRDLSGRLDKFKTPEAVDKDQAVTTFEGAIKGAALPDEEKEAFGSRLKLALQPLKQKVWARINEKQQAAGTPEWLQDQFRQAVEADRARNYELAFQLYEEVTGSKEISAADRGKAYQGGARALSNLRLYDEALTFIDYGLKEDASNPYLLTEKAWIVLFAGREVRKAAVVALRRKQLPEKAVPLMEEARAKFREAVALADQVLAGESKFSQALKVRIEAMMDLGEEISRIEGAIAYAEGIHGKDKFQYLRKRLESRRKPELRALESRPELRTEDRLTLSNLDGHLTALEAPRDAAQAEAARREQLRALIGVEKILGRVYGLQAVVFDLAGVLIAGSTKEFVKHFLAVNLGASVPESEIETLARAIFSEPPAAHLNYGALKIGQATPEEFQKDALRKIYRLLKKRETETGRWPMGETFADFRAFEKKYRGVFLTALYESYSEVPENKAVVQKLQERGVPLYILSNNFKEKFEYLRRKFPFLQPIHAILSDAAGAAKPERAIYSLLMQTIGGSLSHAHRRLEPSRILFLDDKEDNLRAAREAYGLYGSHFDGTEPGSLNLAQNDVIAELLSQQKLEETLALLRAVIRPESPYAASVKARAGRVLKSLQGLRDSAKRREMPIRERHINEEPALQAFYEAPLGEQDATGRIEVLIDTNLPAVAQAFGTPHRKGDRYYFLRENGAIFALARENRAKAEFSTVPMVNFSLYGAARDIKFAHAVRSAYYIGVLNYMEAYRASGLAPAGVRLMGIEPPVPERFRNLDQSAALLEQRNRRGSRRDLRKHAVDYWAYQWAPIISSIQVDDDDLGYFFEAPTAFLIDAAKMQTYQDLNMQSLAAFNHLLTQRYYQTKTPDLEAYARARAEDKGVFPVIIVPGIPHGESIDLESGPMTALVADVFIAYTLGLKSEDEMLANSEVTDIIGGEDILLARELRRPAVPIHIGREDGDYNIPVYYISRQNYRAPREEDLKYLDLFFEPQKFFHGQVQDRHWVAWHLGHHPLTDENGLTRVGEAFVRILAAGPQGFEEQTRRRVIEALDRQRVPVTLPILERLLGPARARVFAAAVPVENLSFREIAATEFYARRDTEDEKITRLLDYAMQHADEPLSLQRLNAARSGHTLQDPLVRRLMDSRGEKARGEALERLFNHIPSDRRLPYSWGERRKQAAQIQELRGRLGTQEQEALDLLTPETALKLAGQYHRELDALYETEVRVREVEFQMVFDVAGLSRPERLKTYDEARREIAELINRDELYQAAGRAGYRDIFNAVRKLGLDESYARRYYYALIAWKQARIQLQRVLAHDSRVPAALAEGPRLADVITKVSHVAQNRENLKDFTKPLIVVVAGGAGVGKSTVAKGLSRFAGLSRYSSDLSRDNVRGEVAKDVIPALHESSFTFRLDDYESLAARSRFLKQYFEHAYATLYGTGKGGVFAEWKRQIKEGESAVWEGVAFFPGFIPAEFYEKANIVHIVVDVPGISWQQRKEIHLARLDGRAKDTADPSRAPSRYQKDINPIRTIQEEMWEYAALIGMTHLQN
ncbi:MAG TPA: HAD family hydrolase, partial [Verrucomicrobiae bacterium]|nr:HAD family hydrolase [Verrucomicrobiae bacterium]